MMEFPHCARPVDILPRKEKMFALGRILGLALVVSITAAAVPLAASATIMSTNGARKTDLVPRFGQFDSSTGVLCDYVQAGKDNNTPANGPNCPGPKALAGKLSNNDPGEGQGPKAKYTKDNQGMLHTDSDAMSRFATDGALNPPMNTLSTARGSWESFLMNKPGEDTEFGAFHRYKVEVARQSLLFSPGGKATAEIKDPFEFVFSSSGTLSYGTSFVATSTDPFSFLSDDPSGMNLYRFSSSVTNVSLSGTAFSGELFSLVMSATGIIGSPSDITVQFLPSEFFLTEVLDPLGLNPGSIANSIKSSMNKLPDGSVGFNGDFVLIGNGGLIPLVTFDALPGTTVTYSDDDLAVAQSVPEPSSFALITCGALALICVAVICGPVDRRRQSLLVKRQALETEPPRDG